MSGRLRLRVFQHVAFETSARIGEWALSRGHEVAETHLYRGEPLPELDEFDWLVVMGGPMNVYEYRLFPWLRDERQLLERAIDSGKTVLGVCLGAQLLADALGARVYQNPEKEIGWLPIQFAASAEVDRFFPQHDPELTVFHWHGDTFDLPRGACRLASSVACENQAFGFGNRIAGLQFHLECTRSAVAGMVGNGANELIPGPFIQTREQILEATNRFEPGHSTLEKLLGRLESTTLRDSQATVMETVKPAQAR
jgi:GMP synthase-like glutamine amidotransferase